MATWFILLLPVCRTSKLFLCLLEWFVAFIRRLPSQNILQVIPEAEVVDVLDIGEAPHALPALLVHEPRQLRRHLAGRFAVAGPHEHLNRAVGPPRGRRAGREAAFSIGAVPAVRAARAAAALLLGMLTRDAAADVAGGEAELGETVGGGAGARVGVAAAARAGAAALAARGGASAAALVGAEELAGEDVAVAHLVAQVRPLGRLVGRHARPDQVGVVREQAQRQRPGQSREEPDARHAQPAHVNALDHDRVQVLAEAFEAQFPGRPAAEQAGGEGVVVVREAVVDLRVQEHEERQVCAVEQDDAGAE